MKIAVTAASGRLGDAIVRELVTRVGPESVVAVARSPEKVTVEGVEVRPGEYEDRRALVEALAGVDVVLLVSGMAHPDDRIGQHRNVIEAAKAAGARKLVYTSIYGNQGRCAFDAIIASNRQTEADVEASGLDFAIGRNGLYIDADIEALDHYKAEGRVVNSAGTGRCAYTSRPELAAAFASLILEDRCNGGRYTLCGEPVTQQQLVDTLNRAYNLNLTYDPISVEAYRHDRTAVHGEFLGGIIAGIYEGIHAGAFDLPSDFETVTGRPHKSLAELVQTFPPA